MTDVSDLLLQIPEQGIIRRLNETSLVEFLRAEQRWYATFLPSLRNPISVFNNGIQIEKIGSRAGAYFSTLIQKVMEGQREELDKYISDAQNLKIIVGQGSIGQRLERMLASRPTDAALALAVFNSDWLDKSSQNLLLPLRAIQLSNPSIELGPGLQTVAAATEASQEMQASFDEQRKLMEAFIAEKSKAIHELEDLFRQKLPVEEPANFWLIQSKWKRREWWFWLGLFAGLIFTPLGFLVWYWSIVEPELLKIATGGQTINVGLLAVISIPALFYGWLLKNVSRVFIQRMNLADDAAHRRALAITWLGLVAEKRFDLSAQERALVLKAMFRPVPFHSQDDGPPSGWFELLKNK